MPSLLELPQNVWRDNIVFFLNKVEDLVRVDSAVMSKILRETFLANIRGCKRFELLTVEQNHGKVRWCAMRSVIASYVNIVGEVQRADAIYIPQFVSGAESISLLEVSDRFLVTQLLGANHLLDLNLYSCEVPDLSSLAECALLKKLRIQECPNVSNENFVEGIAGCVRLSSCYWAHCDKLGADAIVALLKCCINLTELHLIGFFDLDAVFAHVHTVVCLESFTSDSSLPSTPAVVRGIAAFMPCLHTLRLLHPSNTVTDADMDILVRKCSNLTHLQLLRHTLLTSATLVTIGKQLMRMLSLQLSGCPAVNDASVIALAQSLGSLRTLQLADLRITDASIQAVGTYCRGLQDLDISYCSFLTDDAFLTLKVEALGCLDVSGTQVTGSFAARIFSNKSSLHCLICHDCHHLDDSFLRALLRPYSQLRTLRLGSVSISTAGWLKLSTLFPSILLLVIRNVLEVHDDVVHSFYTNCTELCIASIAGCNVSPKFLSLSQFRKSLKS